MQLHLLDATYELFRAHFGRPPVNDPSGRLVGATVGLVESVLRLLRNSSVTHIGCATDHIIRSWRNERYAGYKTEAGMPPVLLAQFDLAETALRSLGLVVWPMVEFEADDALATAAARWADARGVDRIVILSPDKDLAQCVRPDGRVVAFDRRRERWIDADAVRAKFGVDPESIPDWLALVGDAADGFPGLRGWGTASAAAILSRYRHLEAIPPDGRDWGVPLRNATVLAATLRDCRAEAELYRELATLRCDVPLTESLDDLAWRGVPREPFSRLVATLGAPHLASRVPRWAE
ncbi:MAG: flap endonuclease [Chloroflexi bacterium]|nr:flap endonuclease [Chloroflexota bacterium]